jgi:hypothetical protein
MTAYEESNWFPEPPPPEKEPKKEPVKYHRSTGVRRPVVRQEEP